MQVGDERRRNGRDDERAYSSSGRGVCRQLLARELAASGQSHQLDALTWWLIRVWVTSKPSPLPTTCCMRARISSTAVFSRLLCSHADADMS